MTQHSDDHQAIAWLKHRLEDLDTIIHAGEDAASDLQGAVREGADAALDRLKASRAKLEAFAEELRDNAAAAKDRGDQALQRLEVGLEDEWIEIETAYQDFVSGLREAGELAYEATQALIAARATAQKRAWAASIEETRDHAKTALDDAGEEFRTAVQTLEGQFESLKARTLQAGDAAWESLSETLSKARNAQEHAFKRVKDTLSKAL